MSTQPLDYAMILADLEAKRAAIEASIAAIRAAMGLGAVNPGDVQTGIGSAAPQAMGAIFGNDIPDGAFLGKGIPEATKLLLEILKKKQTTREIADALQRGGIESTSSNFVGIVHAVLNRARKAPNSAIVKLGSHWGLKDWYPKGIVSAAAPPATKAKKRKKKAGKTAKSSDVPQTASEGASTSSGPKTAPRATTPAIERIETLLKSEPKAEFSAQDIATNFAMNAQVTAMLLGKLVKAGHVEKTQSGTFRYSTQATVQ